MDELLSISTNPSPFCRARTVSLLTEFFYHLSRLLQAENTGTDTIPEDIRKFMDQQPAEEGGMKVKMMEVTLSDDASPAKPGRDKQPDDATAKFSFGDLKFGSDYSPENDK